jgi:hypothetical protein
VPAILTGTVTPAMGKIVVGSDASWVREQFSAAVAKLPAKHPHKIVAVTTNLFMEFPPASHPAFYSFKNLPDAYSSGFFQCTIWDSGD